jgi:protein-tyrosine phosphatase
MPEVVEWRSADRPALVRRAVATLSGGGLVAFPTDTVYHLAASALAPAAVARLAEGNEPLVLAVRGAGDALDWAPDMSGTARRLARRCWPGPVTLAFASGAEGGVASRLPAGVRERLGRDGELWLRAPAHEAPLLVLDRLAGPLLIAAVPCDGGQAIAAGAVVRVVGDRAALVIDDGPCQLYAPATVVRVGRDSWEILVPGAVPEEAVRQLSPCTIVFICTGNTCRSPLAEALCKKLLAERLGCDAEGLEGRGYRVLSAGLAAAPGGEAAAEAVEVARELGADLSGHRSRRLTAELLAHADQLIAMTQGHLRALVPYCGGEGARVRLLSGGEDIDDPIGGDQEVYRECARQIVCCLERLLPELQEG